jgi:hypothetical protein
MSADTPGTCLNLVNGEWQPAQASRMVVDPMNGEAFLSVPDTTTEELAPFVASDLVQPRLTQLHAKLYRPL